MVGLVPLGFELFMGSSGQTALLFFDMSLRRPFGFNFCFVKSIMILLSIMLTLLQFFFFSCHKAFGKNSLSLSWVFEDRAHKHWWPIREVILKQWRSGVLQKKGSIREKAPWGFQRVWLAGIWEKTKNTEKEAAKNKSWVLLFCLGSVQMLGVNSCVKQNPCQVNKRRFGLMQVTLSHWFRQLKAGDFSSPCVPNWSSALVYSKEVVGSLFKHKTRGSYMKSIVIPGELVVPEDSKKEKYYSVLSCSELQMWQVRFRTAILCFIQHCLYRCPLKKEVLDHFHWRP